MAFVPLAPGVKKPQVGVPGGISPQQPPGRTYSPDITGSPQSSPHGQPSRNPVTTGTNTNPNTQPQTRPKTSKRTRRKQRPQKPRMMVRFPTKRRDDERDPVSHDRDRFGTAFNVITPGPELEFWSEIDTSYYTNTSDNTLVDLTTGADATNTARVQTKTVNVTEDSILEVNLDDPATNSDKNIIMEAAFSRIFSELKYQVNARTRGGNAQTKTVMTYTNVKKYLKHMIAAYHAVAELNARQAWDPDIKEVNPVCRLIASSLKTDSELFSYRDLLQDVMANYSLPVKVMEYLTLIWSPFKVSPVEGGTVHFLTSTDMRKDLWCINNEHQTTGGPLRKWDNVKNRLTHLTKELSKSTHINDWSAISALLTEQTDINYQPMRFIRPPVASPIYNVQWNMFMSNAPTSIEGTTNTPVLTSNSALTTDASINFAAPVDADSILKSTSAHLLLSWGQCNIPGNDVEDLNTTGGFPFFMIYNLANQGQNDGKYFTDFLWTNQEVTSSDDRGYRGYMMRGSEYDKLNNNYKLSPVYDGGRKLYSPTGLNVKEYMPSFASCSQSCSDWLKHLFD